MRLFYVQLQDLCLQNGLFTVNAYFLRGAMYVRSASIELCRTYCNMYIKS